MRRECRDSGTQALLGLPPEVQGFRAMEDEGGARTRVGIACVGEARDLAGALVLERQRLGIGNQL